MALEKEQISPTKKKPTHWKVTLYRVLALLFVLGISIFIFSIRDEAEKLALYGYPGIFILSFLAYATVFLPAPGILIIFTMAGIGDFNWFYVGMVAGFGAALGETIGYLAGFSGQGVVENTKYYDRISFWFQRNASLTILALSILPNPFFDLVGVIAGAFKISVYKFIFWCWIGESIKMLFFSFLGVYFFDILKNFI